MELVLNNSLQFLDNNELEYIDGGLLLFGITVSGVLCAKMLGLGITAGITVAGIYYSQK